MYFFKLKNLLSFFLAITFVIPSFAQYAPTAMELDTAMINANAIEEKMDQMIKSEVDSKAIFTMSSGISGVAAFVGTYFFTQRQRQKVLEKYWEEMLIQSKLTELAAKLEKMPRTFERSKEKITKILNIFNEHSSIMQQLSAYTSPGYGQQPRMTLEMFMEHKYAPKISDLYQSLLHEMGSNYSKLPLPNEFSNLEHHTRLLNSSLQELLLVTSDQRLNSLRSNIERSMLQLLAELKEANRLNAIGPELMNETFRAHTFMRTNESVIHKSELMLNIGGHGTLQISDFPSFLNSFEIIQRKMANFNELLPKIIEPVKSKTQDALRQLENLLSASKETTAKLLQKNSFLNTSVIADQIELNLAAHANIYAEVASKRHNGLFSIEGNKLQLRTDELEKFEQIKFRVKGNLKMAAAIAAGAVIITAGAYVVSEIFSSPEEEDATKNLSDAFINGDAATRRAILAKNPEAIQYLQEIKDALI